MKLDDVHGGHSQPRTINCRKHAYMCPYCVHMYVHTCHAVNVNVLCGGPGKKKVVFMEIKIVVW